MLNGKEVPIGGEPFYSDEKLRKRRNDTIHKKSALTSLEMARSSLFTALKVSEALHFHFTKEQTYKYQAVLDKYPLNSYPLFSEMIYPEDFIQNHVKLNAPKQ